MVKNKQFNVYYANIEGILNNKRVNSAEAETEIIQEPLTNTNDSKIEKVIKYIINLRYII